MAELIYLGCSEWEDEYIEIFTSNIRLILAFMLRSVKFLGTIDLCLMELA